VQHLTPPMGTTQLSVELLRGRTTRFNKPQYSTVTQKLCQKTSHLQLGLSTSRPNWIYVVLTIFAQRFNIG